MAQADAKQMIVGLDIGTSKVVAVVGEIDADGGTGSDRHWLSPLKRDEERCRGQYRVNG